jgi:hypothetical protein
MIAYTLLRKVHLYSGLAILAFVIMYFVTGYPMIHRTWFPNPEALKKTRTEPLRYNGPKNPSAYSDYLQKTFDLRGQVTRQRRQKDGSWEFRYSRPGTAYEAVVAPAGDSVRITTVRDNAVQTLIALHELHGYGGGELYNLWAILLDLASGSCSGLVTGMPQPPCCTSFMPHKELKNPLPKRFQYDIPRPCVNAPILRFCVESDSR